MAVVVGEPRYSEGIKTNMLFFPFRFSDFFVGEPRYSEGIKTSLPVTDKANFAALCRRTPLFRGD